MAARLVKVFHVRLDLRDVAESGPHPLAAFNREVGAPRVLRDQKARAQEPAHAPPPPRAETSDDSSVMVLRDDMMVVADREREPLVQTDIGSNGSPAKPRSRRRKSDDSLSVGTIAVTMAAVITVGFAFTALLPSILTRGGVDPTPTLVATPPLVAPPPIEPVGVTEPAGSAGPDQPPAPAPRPAASVDSKSAAQTAPALRTAIPSEKQAGGRVAATGRNDLTAAEEAAVSRGLNELKTTAAIAAPRRPAATRPALTEEEKAAIERGLRELEKTAGEAKP